MPALNLRLLRADSAWRGLQVAAMWAVAGIGAHLLWPDFGSMSAFFLTMACASTWGAGPLHEFALALPVSRRQLALQRLAASLALAALPVAGVVMGQLAFARDGADWAPVVVGGANVAATLGVAAAVWLLIALHGADSFLARAGLFVATAFAASIVSTASTLVVAFGAIAVTGALAYAAVRSLAAPLDPNFDVGAVKPDVELRGIETTIAPRPSVAAERVDRPRTSMAPPRAVGVAEVAEPTKALRFLLARSTVLLWPVTVPTASLANVVLGFQSNALLAITYATWFSLIATRTSLHVIRKTSFLPIPRGRLLLWVAAPSLAMLVVGTCLVHAWRDAPGAPRELPAALVVVTAAWLFATCVAFASGTPPVTWSQRVASAGWHVANTAVQFAPVVPLLISFRTTSASRHPIVESLNAHIHGFLPVSPTFGLAIWAAFVFLSFVVLARRFRVVEVSYKPLEGRHPAVRAIQNA
ncbi:MAG TPA: hypothetical protein VKE69_04730 [Planctomycetota bacterium]|nr:hypothetical protein [Planctomycetota bacterium]